MKLQRLNLAKVRRNIPCTWQKSNLKLSGQSCNILKTSLQKSLELIPFLYQDMRTDIERLANQFLFCCEEFTKTRNNANLCKYIYAVLYCIDVLYCISIKSQIFFLFILVYPFVKTMKTKQCFDRCPVALLCQHSWLYEGAKSCQENNLSWICLLTYPCTKRETSLIRLSLSSSSL